MTRSPLFKNRHKFQDDVWGQIKLNDLERDVIDTPEFQRLFRTSQMGFVDLVYPTANHTRGAHSIGACHIANLLIDKLNQNTGELHNTGTETLIERYARFEISEPERLLIRLGALLHDISHVPLSHDVERKAHRVYYKASDGKTNEIKLRSCTDTTTSMTIIRATHYSICRFLIRTIQCSLVFCSVIQIHFIRRSRLFPKTVAKTKDIYLQGAEMGGPPRLESEDAPASPIAIPSIDFRERW